MKKLLSRPPSTRSRGRSQLLALSRVCERNSAEIARVMASYFRARDEFEPVSRDELLDRSMEHQTVTSCCKL